MDPEGPARRGVLRGIASAAAVALAGCAGQSERTPAPDRTPRGASTVTDTPAEGGGAGSPTPDAASTPTATPTGILLPSLDVGGSPGGLVELRSPGKAALLDFFATWCAPCIPEMDHLRAVRERFDADAVSIVSITQEEDRETVKQFWREHDGTWPVAVDPGLRAVRKYSATNIPTIVILAPDGTEVERHVGLVDESTLARGIEAALGRDGGS